MMPIKRMMLIRVGILLMVSVSCLVRGDRSAIHSHTAVNTQHHSRRVKPWYPATQPRKSGMKYRRKHIFTYQRKSQARDPEKNVNEDVMHSASRKTRMDDQIRAQKELTQQNDVIGPVPNQAIQSDQAPCRDDLCIGRIDIEGMGDTDAGVTDVTEGVTTPTITSFMSSKAIHEPKDAQSISTPSSVFVCPVGYRKVTRRGTDFCSPSPHDTLTNHRVIRCPDGQQAIRWGSRTICDSPGTTFFSGDGCPPEQLAVIHGNHFRCVDSRSSHACPSGQTLVPAGNNVYECRLVKNRRVSSRQRRKRPSKNKRRKGKRLKKPKSTLPKKGISNLKGGKNPKATKGKSKKGPKMSNGRLEDGKQSIPGVPECESGKVAALSETGYVCVEPVFPTSVCPPGLVPLMLPDGLKCAPCPPGQTIVQRDNGISCVTMTTTTETPCPHGLIPLETAVGRVCRYMPPAAEQLNGPPCPIGQITKAKDGVVRCEPKSPTCPPGMTVILKRDGTEVCGVPISYKQLKCRKGEAFVDGRCIKNYMEQPMVTNLNPAGDQHQTISDKVCPPGEHSVQTQHGLICHSSVPILNRRDKKTSHCGPGTILTQTRIDFRCIPTDLPIDLEPISRVPAWRVDEMPINGGTRGVANSQVPGCRRGFVLARTRKMYECITEYDAGLKCEVSETLVRLEDGFICKEALEEAGEGEGIKEREYTIEREEPKEREETREIEVPREQLEVRDAECRPTEVTTIDEHGRSKCITLDTASAMCGDGFVAVPDDRSFICRIEKLELQCPVGFSVSLRQGLPVCVSDTDEDCLDASDRSSSCVVDVSPCLPGYALDNTGGIPTCRMVKKGKNINKKPVKKGTKSWACKGVPTEGQDGAPDDVRPCDFNAELLLAGCNPDCANGGTCVNGSCACPDGITGSACQHDIDECRAARQRLCDHTCVNTFGSFHCTCSHGMIIGTDGRTCTALGCIPDCLNNGSCINGVCACQRGFEGDHCQTDKDECLQHGTRLCQYQCRNTYGGYQCICPPGSKLNLDKRTCMNTTCNPECRNGGECENHRCVCPRGYYGVICQLDINECYKLQPCQHECHNSRGSYTCSCHRDYALHADGHSCIAYDKGT